MEWLKSKQNIVISIVIFLLIIALIAMGIVVNDRTQRLTQKTDELNSANGKITEYSAEIEEHKKNEEDLKKEIEKYKSENKGLKKKIAKLAAKKAASKANSASNKTVTNQKTTPAETKPVTPTNTDTNKNTNTETKTEQQSNPDSDMLIRINNLSEALLLPKKTQKPPVSGVCYLTFDDGPSSNTPKILDILAKYNVKATFFVIGTGNLSLLPRIKSEGHAIGLHANVHDYSVIYRNAEAYLSDLLSLSQKVESIIGEKVSIIRFPGGSDNTVSRNYCTGIMSDLSSRMPILGYSYFDWNISSGDADKPLASTQEIISTTLTYAQNKDSICLLMHDAPGKYTTPEALPTIIERLSAMGYKFDVLTPETHGYHNNVNN